MGVKGIFGPFCCADSTCQAAANSIKVILVDEADGYPGGFKAGDRVFFVGAPQAWPNGDTLQFGHLGTVCLLDFELAQDLIKVVFDNHADFTKVRLSEISREPPQIPGGFYVGDTVFWTGGTEAFASGDHLLPGLKGRVAGKATQGGSTDQEAVAVRFDGNRRVTDVPVSKISTSVHVQSSDKPYDAGDIVYWTGAGQIFDGGDEVVFGHYGVVVSGHLIQDQGDKGGDRVKVQFLNNKSFTAVCVSQLSRDVPVLPCGLNIGDRVRWAVDAKKFSNGDTVRQGTEGVVLGRAAKRYDALDEHRVVVKFDGHAKHHPIALESTWIQGSSTASARSNAKDLRLFAQRPQSHRPRSAQSGDDN